MHDRKVKACAGLTHCGGMQDVRDGQETFRRYQQMLMGLLKHMHLEDPSPDTLAGCLLQVPDPHSGAPAAREPTP